MRARDLPGTCVNTGTLGWFLGAQVFPLVGIQLVMQIASVFGVGVQVPVQMRVELCLRVLGEQFHVLARAIPRTCESNSTYLKALLVKIPRYLPASALGAWSSECILRMYARDLPGACVYTGTLGWVVGAQVFPLGDSNRDANHTSVLGVLERWVRVNSPARLV
jgi:hypothetical protein